MRPLLALLVVLTAVPASAAPAQSLLARDGALHEVEFVTTERSFEFTEADGTTSSNSWRLIEATGNGNENHIVTDRAGRLYDFGGNHINVSEDRGQTWRQVRPTGHTVYAGEGTLVAAPGGDMVGVVWDIYGDTLLALRFEAATGKWRYAPVPVHSPYYDRQWVGVVPGPVTIDGQTSPWVAFVKGGTAKEEWMYSTDGLTYTGLSAKALGTVANGTVRDPLPITPSPELDVVNAPGGMGLTPLGAGRALANPDFLYEFADATQPAGYALLNPQQSVPWSAYRLPGEDPAGQFRVDSRGWVHNVVAEEGGAEVVYRVSDDAGRTFRSTRLAIPQGTSIVTSWDVDFRVDGRLGLAAVAVHANRDAENPDPDLLYKLDVRGPQPALLRSYRVGRGDFPSNSAATGSARFDFASLSMFADGRVAMSFQDSLTQVEEAGEMWIDPQIAVELGEPVPAGFRSSPLPALGPPDPPGSPGPPGRPRPVGSAGPSGIAHHVRLKARRRGGRILLRGEVRPRHPGHRVRIQRRAGQRWVTVARVRANRRSAFRVTVRRRGRVTLRAVAARDGAGHLGGRSRRVRVG